MMTSDWTATLAENQPFDLIMNEEMVIGQRPEQGQRQSSSSRSQFVLLLPLTGLRHPPDRLFLMFPNCLVDKWTH
jgi:hypothetical protein